METPTVTARAASAYVLAGRSVIPIDKRDKSPLLNSWKCFQQHPATVEVVQEWFTNGALVAIIGGKVSGGYEGIDFDNKGRPDATTLIHLWMDLVEAAAPGLLDRLPIEYTPSGGYHVTYLCDQVEGNTVLARRPPTADELEREPKCKWKTLIETRGEGGYLVVAPSPGYKLIRGNHREPARITPAERAILFDCARQLNTYEDAPSTPKRRASRSDGRQLPGEDYNRRGDVETLLVRHGWRRVKTTAKGSLWRRPGKHDGHSGSLDENNAFYVFSSNAAPLEAEHAYSPFALYTELEHDGDYRASARDLAHQGYGDPLPPREEHEGQRAWLAGLHEPRPAHRPYKLSPETLETHYRSHMDGDGIVLEHVDETARAFGVSVRTVQRCDAALRNRGICERKRMKDHTTIVAFFERDKSTAIVVIPSGRRHTGQHRTPPPVACQPVVVPIEQEYPVCKTCRLGEVGPRDDGIWICSNCTSYVAVGDLVLEAWGVYGKVHPPAKRYELMYQYVITNGRPDVPEETFTDDAKLFLKRHRRSQETIKLVTTLRKLSARALRGRASNYAGKVEELQQAGKRKQAYFWGLMLWHVEQEIARRKEGD